MSAPPTTADSLHRGVPAAPLEGRVRALAVLFTLLTATTLAYLPTLGHMPRGDQLIYLYEMRERSDFWELTGANYAFNRAALDGDHLLFRPVLYFLLGAELWAFGYQFHLWQLTSLVLHLLTVASVFQYALRWLPASAVLAAAVSTLYALNYAGSELVYWHHLSGYALFGLLTVQALIACERLMRRPTPVAGAWLLLLVLIAAFTYELGNVMAAVLAVRLLARAARSRCRVIVGTACGLLAVPVLYLGLSVWDYLHQFPVPAESTPTAGSIWMVVPAMVFALGYWAAGTLLPAILTLELNIYDRVGLTHLNVAFDPWLAVNALGVLCIAGALAAGLRARETRPQTVDTYAHMSVLAALAAGYGAIIASGRLIERGAAATLAGNTYYAQFFGLLFALGLVHVVSRWAGRARAVMIFGLISIAVVGGLKIWQLGSSLAAWSTPQRAFVAAVGHLRESRPNMGTFTFSTVGPCPGNRDVFWFSRFARGTRPSYELGAILFADSYRSRAGRYRVECDGSGTSPDGR